MSEKGTPPELDEGSPFEPDGPKEDPPPPPPEVRHEPDEEPDPGAGDRNGQQ